jgi:hypothetical protein
MSYTLESLHPGTPVFVGDVHVGDIRAVYAAGAARSAELLVVHWLERDEDVALPATEVARVDGDGVRLLSNEVSAYETLATFDPARFPTVHPLS